MEAPPPLRAPRGRGINIKDKKESMDLGFCAGVRPKARQYERGRKPRTGNGRERVVGGGQVVHLHRCSGHSRMGGAARRGMRARRPERPQICDYRYANCGRPTGQRSRLHGCTWEAAVVPQGRSQEEQNGDAGGGADVAGPATCRIAASAWGMLAPLYAHGEQDARIASSHRPINRAGT